MGVRVARGGSESIFGDERGEFSHSISPPLEHSYVNLTTSPGFFKWERGGGQQFESAKQDWEGGGVSEFSEHYRGGSIVLALRGRGWGIIRSEKLRKKTRVIIFLHPPYRNNLTQSFMFDIKAIKYKKRTSINIPSSYHHCFFFAVTGVQLSTLIIPSLPRSYISSTLRASGKALQRL